MLEDACAREVGARCADVFAGAKGVCLRQGVSRSEVESVSVTFYLKRPPPLRSAGAALHSSPLKWGQCFFS